MPRIPARLKTDEFKPSDEWPEDCLVQWGRSGLVLSKTNPYTTAFIEAFPADGSAGFIRAEGDTLEEAERKGLESWKRKKACFDNGGHRWARGLRLADFEDRKRKAVQIPKLNTYTNGGCFCLGCMSFQTAMKPIHKLGAWREPLNYSQIDIIMSGMLKPDPQDKRDPNSKRLMRRIFLKAKVAGIDLPDSAAPELQERADDAADPWAETPYELACQRAVADWYRVKKIEMEAPGIDSMQSLFNSLTRSRLDRLLQEVDGRDKDISENDNGYPEI